MGPGREALMHNGSLTFSKAIFLGNGLVAIVSGLFANMLADNLGFGPVSPFDAAACFLTIGMAIIMLSWTKNYGDPSDSKDLMAQFKVAAAAIASDEKIALLGAIQSLFEGSMYTFVFLWTPALSPNDEDIPHGFIFATFMLSSMLGSSIASRLMARPALKVENYMQIIFAISAFTLLLPVVTTFFIASSGVKGGSISFAGSIQLLGFCTFEAVIASFYSMVLIIGGHVHSLPKDEQPGSDSSRTSIIICGVILCSLTLALTSLLG